MRKELGGGGGRLAFKDGSFLPVFGVCAGDLVKRLTGPLPPKGVNSSAQR